MWFLVNICTDILRKFMLEITKGFLSSFWVIHSEWYKKTNPLAVEKYSSTIQTKRLHCLLSTLNAYVINFIELIAWFNSSRIHSSICGQLLILLTLKLTLTISTGYDGWGVWFRYHICSDNICIFIKYWFEIDRKCIILNFESNYRNSRTWNVILVEWAM